MRTRRVRANGGIGTVPVIGNSSVGSAPFRRDGINAGAAVGNRKCKPYPLGIGASVKVVYSDSRRSRINSAYHRLPHHSFAVMGKREGIHSVGSCSVGKSYTAASYYLRRTVRFCYLYIYVCGHSRYVDAPLLRPSVIIRAYHQLQR